MISKTAELRHYNKFVWYNEYYYAHNNTLQNRKSGFYAHHPVCRTTWCWQCLSKIVLNYLFTVSVPFSIWNLLVLDWIVEVEEKTGWDIHHLWCYIRLTHQSALCPTGWAIQPGRAGLCHEVFIKIWFKCNNYAEALLFLFVSCSVEQFSVCSL